MFVTKAIINFAQDRLIDGLLNFLWQTKVENQACKLVLWYYPPFLGYPMVRKGEVSILPWMITFSDQDENWMLA